jgi:hypothetical protein
MVAAIAGRYAYTETSSIASPSISTNATTSTECGELVTHQ